MIKEIILRTINRRLTNGSFSRIVCNLHFRDHKTAFSQKRIRHHSIRLDTVQESPPTNALNFNWVTCYSGIAHWASWITFLYRRQVLLHIETSCVSTYLWEIVIFRSYKSIAYRVRDHSVTRTSHRIHQLRRGCASRPSETRFTRPWVFETAACLPFSPSQRFPN